MKLKIFFFARCIIFCSQCYFINALVGENITSVTRGTYNFVVSIMLNNRNNPHPQRDHGCTGSLVTQRDVLTAAHCVRGKNEDELMMMVGSNDLWRGTKFYPSWWLTYNRWIQIKHLTLEFKSNDLVVIRLTESVEKLDIHPVPLSNMQNQQLYGLKATIIGWGVTNTGQTASILQSVKVKILTNSACSKRVSDIEGRNISFHERLFCTARKPYALMHRGDSGGPLLFNDTLIAVNKGNCPLVQTVIHPNKVNLHFGIDYYRNFILDVLTSY